MPKILLINGPNLNMLGSREPSIYGFTSLKDIDTKLAVIAKQAGHELISFQSNAEHELIDRIHQAKSEKVAFLIMNPASFTHTSLALRDAVLAVDIPMVEVHLSNIYKREEFRQHSFFSDIALGMLSGFGAQGYEFALQAAIQHLKLID